MEMDFKKFRKDFAKAVKGLESEYGIKMTLGNISYSQDSFHTKLECVNLASIKSPKEEFANNCIYTFGLIKPEMYNREFTAADNKKYRLTGINPKARKNFCIITSVVNGTEYACPPGFIGIVRKTND
ncbi:hypothetical protein NSB24_01630 [Blautia coccoides]|uniref:hypothetical protein n=1 Tax=Blautia producta TaxID=33035 RepID=UPI00214A79B2|nr:hypothetical protein [Blautia coccoides]MCR1984936.1 hypothetical protein [Blautia coccoides]